MRRSKTSPAATGRIAVKRTLLAFALLLLVATFSLTSLATQHSRPTRKHTAKPRPTPPLNLKGIVEPPDEWLKIASGKLGEYYYNPAKLSRTSKGKVKIWIKETVRDNQWALWRDATIKQRKAEDDVGLDGYSRLDHVLQLYEIDCDKDRLRVLSRIDYDIDGQVLRAVSGSDDVQWSDVVPDSLGESFARQACLAILFDNYIMPPAKPKTSRRQE